MTPCKVTAAGSILLCEEGRRLSRESTARLPFWATMDAEAVRKYQTAARAAFLQHVLTCSDRSLDRLAQECEQISSEKGSGR